MTRPFWRMVLHLNPQCQKMSLGGLRWDICGGPSPHPAPYLHCGEARRPAGGVGKNTEAALLCQQIPEGCSGAVTTSTTEFHDSCWSEGKSKSLCPGQAIKMGDGL